MGTLRTRLVSRIVLPAALLGALPGYAHGPHDHAEHFEVREIATGMVDGYQIVVADLNRDGRLDLLPVASGLDEIAWFENPGWQRHVITGNLTRPENVDVYDVDGDGSLEIGLVSGFSQAPQRSTGIVEILSVNGDPTQPWSSREIDRLPTSHRVRWTDIDGSGRKVLVNAPLAGRLAEAPDFRGATPLVYYRPGAWRREVIATNDGVVHGLYVGPREGGAGQTIITAGFAGVFAHALRTGSWQRRRVVAGKPAVWPGGGGASEFTVLDSGAERWLATIEPWYGSELVVYRMQGADWARTVIDPGVGLGHTVLGVDLDADGSDELIVADRGDDVRGVYIYTLTQTSGASWAKEILDPDMQASNCTAADLDGNSRVDLVCIGRATEELNWYRNTLQ